MSNLQHFKDTHILTTLAVSIRADSFVKLIAFKESLETNELMVITIMY